MFRRRPKSLLCVLIALPVAGEGLTLRELISEALANNPAIIALQKGYEAARQRPSQVSSLPDPMFSPGYSSNGRPWPGAGLGSEPTSQIGFTVSQEVPLPGKRKLAGDVAAEEAEADWQQYQQMRLSVVARLKRAYYRRSYAFAAADVLDRNLQLLLNFLRITEVRYQVGRAAQQDVFKAQTQVSILETRRLQLERGKRAREAEINNVVNRAPGATLDRPEDLRPLDLPVGLTEIYAAARENSPMLRLDQKMIERAELAVTMARKDFYPDFTLNSGYYNMGGMPDMFMFRADFRAGVTEQAQTLVQSRKTYEATNQGLHFRLQDDYLMAQTSEQLVRIYRGTVIPQASLALESSLASYATGTVDFLTVFTNYITVVEYELNYCEDLQNLYVALSQLEEMTAMQLIP